MLENLIAQPADKILALVAAYRADPRDEKVDLGVGVYKDASGNTPVMRAVKEAERRILADQSSKPIRVWPVILRLVQPCVT